MHRLGVIFIGGLIGMEILGCATHNGSVRSAAGRASVTAPPRPAAGMASVTAPTLHCKSSGGLSDHACTPGVVRTTSVQSICHGGSTKRYRPPTSYTNNLKVQQIAEYEYTEPTPKSFKKIPLICLKLEGMARTRRTSGPR